jgi:inhibitor of cysteine peptidase
MTVLKALLRLAILALIASGCATATAPEDSDEVRVESIDILILESFPVQVRAVLRGTTRDGCIVIDDVDATREGNAFELTIVSSRLDNARCSDERQPFEENVPLDVHGLPAGAYTVTTGELHATFELAVDNAP